MITTQVHMNLQTKEKVHFYFCWICSSVCDSNQDNMMNTHGSFYSVVFQINLKDNISQYYAAETFEECSMRQYYWMRNKWQYLRTLIHLGQGLGCSRTLWVRTIQVHPFSKLQVDWINSGLAGGGWVPWAEGGGSLLHMIPQRRGRAEIYSTQASLAQYIEHKCTPNGSEMTRPAPEFLCLE
jgi:hypothetical protein